MSDWADEAAAKIIFDLATRYPTDGFGRMPCAVIADALRSRLTALEAELAAARTELEELRKQQTLKECIQHALREIREVAAREAARAADLEAALAAERATADDAHSAAQKIIGLLHGQVDALKTELATEKAKVAKLREAAASAIADFDDLVGDSEGVYGLHRNGDNAPWCELSAGGPFEEWTAGIETLRRIHEETA